jgi:uncharacterized protein YkwD
MKDEAVNISITINVEDMACNGYFSLTGSDGSTIRDRIIRHGYNATWVGENIFSGILSNPTEIVTWWMNSAAHRANILNTNATSFCVGYVFGNTTVDQKFWTVNLAHPGRR